jgi:hypothetical protein
MSRIYLVYGAFSGLWWGKVGLANSDGRVSNHLHHGWLLYNEWRELSSARAWELETEIKHVIKIMDHVDAAHMPQGGYTETFPAAHISEIEQLIYKRIEE